MNKEHLQAKAEEASEHIWRAANALHEMLNANEHVEALQFNSRWETRGRMREIVGIGMMLQSMAEGKYEFSPEAEKERTYG